MNITRHVQQAARSDIDPRDEAPIAQIQPFKILTTEGSDEAIKRDYVVDRLIERDNIALAIGYPESAKSTWALAMAASIVCKAAFCGHETTSQDQCALIFTPERPKEMRRRLRAYENYYGVDLSKVGIVGDHLDFAHGEDHAHRAIATARDQTERTGSQLGLIVFDTVFDLLGGGDENHPRDMGSVSRRLQQIRSEADAPILAICHPSMERAHEPRGHKSLLAKADLTVVLSFDQKTGVRRWRVQKANSLETKSKGVFVCKSVSVGADTAPVMEAGGAFAPAGSREEVVRKLIEEAPNGHVVVSDLAKSAHRTPAFENSQEDACRVAVDRIVRSMAGSGIIEIVGHGKSRQVRKVA